MTVAAPVLTHQDGGQVIALVVVAALALVLRWVYSVRGREERMRAARAARDYGTLVPVRTLPSADAAEQVRAALADAGVRATVGPALGPEHGEPVRISANGYVLPRATGPVGVHVLVFPADLGRAEDVLGTA